MLPAIFLSVSARLPLECLFRPFQLTINFPTQNGNCSAVFSIVPKSTFLAVKGGQYLHYLVLLLICEKKNRFILDCL